MNKILTFLRMHPVAPMIITTVRHCNSCAHLWDHTLGCNIWTWFGNIHYQICWCYGINLITRMNADQNCTYSTLTRTPACWTACIHCEYGKQYQMGYCIHYMILDKHMDNIDVIMNCIPVVDMMKEHDYNSMILTWTLLIVRKLFLRVKVTSSLLYTIAIHMFMCLIRN